MVTDDHRRPAAIRSISNVAAPPWREKREEEAVVGLVVVEEWVDEAGFLPLGAMMALSLTRPLRPGRKGFELLPPSSFNPPPEYTKALVKDFL